MSDRELGVTFTGDISDISAKLESLVSELGQLQDMTIDLTVNADTSAVEQLESDLNGLAPSADTAANELDQVSNSSNEAANNMNNMGDSSTNASSSMMDLSGVIGQFSSEAGKAVNQVENLAKNFLGAESAAAFLAPEVLGVVAAVAAFTAAVAIAVPAAGEFQDSWMRLGQAVGEGSDSITQLQGDWNDAISSMKENTGRSAGVIRNHIISMGIAGVESKDLIIDSFTGISGAAFVTGQSVDSIESAYKRVISTGMLGTRQLMTFGLTTDDVFAATGLTMDQVRDKFKSMDAEGRAAMMNQILNAKYGTEANEAYKNSWQGVTDKMKAAFDYLAIAFGSIFLPIVIPAMRLLTDLVNFVAAGLMKLAPIGSILGGVFSAFGNVIKGVANVFMSLWSVIGNTSVLLGALPLLLGPVGILLSPIGVAVGFIADNWGRLNSDIQAFFAMIQSGDWGGALELLVAELKWAFVDSIVGFFQDLPRRIGELSSQFLDIGKDIINWIVAGLTSLSSWLDEVLNAEFVSGGEAGATGMVDGFGKWLDDNGWKIAEIIGDLITQVTPKLLAIFAKLALLLAKQLLDSLTDGVKDIPNQMYIWGQNILQGLVDGLMSKMGPFKDILNYIRDHWPHSPPKTGPLSEVTEESMYEWVSGLMGAATDASGNFMLSGVKLQGGLVPKSGSIANTDNSSSTVNVNVDMNGANINSGTMTAEEAGSTIGGSVAKQVSSALNGGVSVINYKRGSGGRLN